MESRTDPFDRTVDLHFYLERVRGETECKGTKTS